MKTADFDYILPPELIAQTPVEPRDHSRLMVLDRAVQSIAHRHFFNIVDYLKPGDVLVFNDSRVVPARFYGQKDTGARVEVLLLQRMSPKVWQALVRPGKRLQVGARFKIIGGPSHHALDVSPIVEVIDVLEGGIRVLQFSEEETLPKLGEIALPPYIHTPLQEPERYQTVYSRINGSVAAPTAGLHFTKELLKNLEIARVSSVFVTLHVGLDTFQPVREDDPGQHRIHREYGVITADAAQEISRARGEGRRIICIGTTAVRLVEAAAQKNNLLQGDPFTGWVDLFILPGFRFKVTDIMITNFHLPRTTLLMLVSAFTGRDFILSAYNEAIKEQYRFYSFGDAMLIT
jgi:S-adenosylmethionine:tRNA ribosyltransferase-isomerase